MREKRAENGSLKRVSLARSLPPKHGKNASLEYFVDFNGQRMEEVFAKGVKEGTQLLDCVRPRDILGLKTPLSSGEDGKTIFGRKLMADRGKDELWQFADGVEKSSDGLQILSALKSPGYVMVDKGKLVVRAPVKISADKMTASISLYPSQNPRFALREDKVIAMLAGAGVKHGIKEYGIRDAVQKVNATKEPILDFVAAEGTKPVRGQDGSFIFAIDVGSTVGEVRADGSMDFKNRNIFLNVRKGQLLMIKRLPTLGEDGTNVLGERVPPAKGSDSHMEARDNIEVSANGLEYRAKVDGILEVKGKMVRVIPGLLVQSDVSFKTGHIDGGRTEVFVRGSVLPDFKVSSELDVIIEKVAEACDIRAGQDVHIRGGIIGKERAFIRAGRDVEALYISNGATIEVGRDLKVHAEILNSKVRVAGNLECHEGAGVLSGGEIWVFGHIRVKTLGSYGSESPTVVYLGAHYFKFQEIHQQIEALGLNQKIAELEAQLAELQKELAQFAQVPEQGASREFQEKYMKALDQKRSLMDDLDKVRAEKERHLSLIPYNKDAVIYVSETLFPGVHVIYKDVSWTVKEAQRGVEILWNPSSSNIISKRP